MIMPILMPSLIRDSKSIISLLDNMRLFCSVPSALKHISSSFILLRPFLALRSLSISCAVIILRLSIAFFSLIPRVIWFET